MAIYDRATAQHSARVGQMARAIGEHLGLSAEELEVVLWAGALHDLGKLGVDVAVLYKAGPLSEQDWAEIHRHPVVGSNLILAISPELSPVAAAVSAHHERWDGTGYPDHLQGDEIPMTGRIVAVADVFDAMTHLRPYRSGRLSPEEAVAEIRQQSGQHFDPMVVDAFCQLGAAAFLAETQPSLARVYSALFATRASGENFLCS